MRTNVNEVEMRMAKSEKQTLELAAEITNTEMRIESVMCVPPRDIRQMLARVNQSLSEENRDLLNESERYNLLRMRSDLRAIGKGIGQAHGKFDEGY